MKSAKLLLSFILFISSLSVMANGVKVDTVYYEKSANKVHLKVSWKNAWRQTLDYHDAVWIFCKYKTVNVGYWMHADIKAGSTTASGLLETREVNDKLGFFVRLNTDTTTDVASTTVSFEPEGIIGLYPDFKVFATEMVYVPEGAFWAGAASPDTGTFWFSDMNSYVNRCFHEQNFISGMQYRPLRISSENQLTSNLARTIRDEWKLSAGFPKGYSGFYCMKHEISNAQLIDFLNTIPDNWLNEFRLNLTFSSTGIRNIYQGVDTLNPISPISAFYNATTRQLLFGCDGNKNGILNEPNDELDYPAFIPHLVYFNFLYWAGLVPMTEFQFEKSARGPLYPTNGEKAFGPYNTLVVSSGDLNNKGTADEKLNRTIPGPVSARLTRCGAFADSSSDRLTSGASFYGILNYQDNVLEITVESDTANNLFTGASVKTDQFFLPSSRGIRATRNRGLVNIDNDEEIEVFYPIYFRPRPIPKNSDGLNYPLYMDWLYINSKAFQMGGRGVKNLN